MLIFNTFYLCLPLNNVFPANFLKKCSEIWQILHGDFVYVVCIDSQQIFDSVYFTNLTLLLFLK